MTQPVRYNTRPVIGTSIATGQEIRLVGGTAIDAAGFEIACVFRCCAGKQKYHAGYTWRYECERIRKPSHVPRRPQNIPKKVFGRETGTKRTITLIGKEEIRAAGFEPSCISRVACGKQTHHKGWVFEYLPD